MDGQGKFVACACVQQCNEGCGEVPLVAQRNCIDESLAGFAFHADCFCCDET